MCPRIDRYNLGLHPPASRAFSIVELVLVMAIIVVIAGISAPRYFTALDNYRADAAARRIAADLELARTRARSQSAPCSIAFDAGAETYQLQPAGDVVALNAAPYHAAILSVTLNPNDAAILSFDGYGKPDREATIVLRSGDTQRTIHLDDSSGEVTVK